jgi:hypothetical protein
MARYPQSGNKSRRVADVLSDHGSPLGKMLKHASFLIQLQHFLSGFLDPAVAAHFQIATIKKDRLILISPSALWATQLRMQAPKLIKSLQDAGYMEIRKIDVRVAPLAEQQREPRRKKPLSEAAKQALDHMSLLKPDAED